MFRNETSKVVTKAQTQRTWGNSNSLSLIKHMGLIRDGGNQNSATDFSGAPTQPIDHTTVFTRNLSVPLEDEATSYFFHNFVPEDPFSLALYSKVLPVLYRQESTFGTLPKIVDAIGLAGISNMKHAPNLMVTASQKYARVLRVITASIQDSKEASSDQTLVAIMLLGMFEVNTRDKTKIYFQF